MCVLFEGRSARRSGFLLHGALVQFRAVAHFTTRIFREMTNRLRLPPHLLESGVTEEGGGGGIAVGGSVSTQA